MKQIAGYAPSTAWVLVLVLLIAGCGGDDPSAPPPPPGPGIVSVVVRDLAGAAPVANSNVVLYRAENGEAVVRALSAEDGTVHFAVDEGDYYLRIAAQGFEPVPPETAAPLPFFVTWEDTLPRMVSLQATDDAGSTGYVLGSVAPALGNVLILAEAQGAQESYTTSTGPDGFYVLFNLPHDTYDLRALRAGYQMDAAVTAAISAEAEADTAAISISPYQGSTLDGQVSFLAVENSVVDITLLDPRTRAVIPGLTTRSDASGLTYGIENIPDGAYLAWASLQNDGFVIDPDWLFKNPGGLDVAFAAAGSLELNFSVTGAIGLVAPTNPPEATVPALADSTVPTFQWEPYASAKEYFIEVRDADGNLLWGGMNSDGTVNHDFIAPGAQSVTYDFDGRAVVPALEPGVSYQWRIWADRGTQTDSFVEQLISASEDLRGIFQVPAGSE